MTFSRYLALIYRKTGFSVKLIISALAFIFSTVPTLTTQADTPLPSLGDSSSGVVSFQQEHLLGRAWLAALRSRVPTMDDPELKEYVEKMIYRLVSSSQVKDRRIEVVVLDSPELNAFAVPGGIVGINAGLLLYARNEQEFASVIAHELAHLSQRHFARNVEQAKRNRPMDLAATLASVVLLAAGGGDAGIAALAGSQAAIASRQLAYSRQFEQEADRIGMLNLERAGMDPRAMPEMFEQMARASRFMGQRPPEFLLTHPVTESRIADTLARAAQYPKKSYKSSEAFYLMKKRVELHYARSSQGALQEAQAAFNAKKGNLEANRYALALALSDANRTSEAKKMLAPLVKKYPDNIHILIANAQIENQAGQSEAAAKQIKSALALSPESFPLKYVYANTLMDDENYQEAEKILIGLSRQRPADPDVWQLLSESYGMARNILGVYMARAEYFRLTGDLDKALDQLKYAEKSAGSNFATQEKIKAKIAEIKQYKKAMEFN